MELKPKKLTQEYEYKEKTIQLTAKYSEAERAWHFTSQNMKSLYWLEAGVVFTFGRFVGQVKSVVQPKKAPHTAVITFDRYPNATQLGTFMENCVAAMLEQSE